MLDSKLKGGRDGLIGKSLDRYQLVGPFSRSRIALIPKLILFVRSLSNFGDTSTITHTCATSVKEICNEYQGNTNGKVSIL